MDFSLSQEQVLLRDSAERFVADNGGVERHREQVGAAAGFDPGVWDQFAQLGWLAVPFSESQGGIGGGPVDVMVLCEALGRGVLRQPYLSTVITCGGLLSRAGSARQQADHLPGIIDGSRQWAFACAEHDSGYDPAAVSCRAESDREQFRLSGEKIAVLNADRADHLVVTARTSGDRTEPQGISLFVVDRDLPGVNLEAFTAVDGSRGAHLRLDSVAVGRESLLGNAGDGLDAVEAVIDESVLAMGAEALGTVQVLLDATVEYTRTREQFGQPIGKFQALQHRMADMYLAVEELRSLVLNAAIQLSEGSQESAQACAALKVKLAEAGRFVSQQAVQLHGGIGMSDELAVGHHFKRLLLLSKLYGDEEYFLQRYMALSGAAAA